MILVGYFFCYFLSLAAASAAYELSENNTFYCSANYFQVENNNSLIHTNIFRITLPWSVRSEFTNILYITIHMKFYLSQNNNPPLAFVFAKNFLEKLPFIFSSKTLRDELR